MAAVTSDAHKFDETLLDIVDRLTLKEAVTASQIAYVVWKRTGRNVDDHVFEQGLERLFIAGRIRRVQNIRKEFAYYGGRCANCKKEFPQDELYQHPSVFGGRGLCDDCYVGVQIDR